MSGSSLSSLSNLTHLLAICNAADSDIILSCPGQLFGSSPLSSLESTVMFYSYPPSSLSKQHFQDHVFFFCLYKWSWGLYLSSGVLQVPPPSSADIPISAICLKYSWYHVSVVWLLAKAHCLWIQRPASHHLTFLHHILFPCYSGHSDLYFIPFSSPHVFTYVWCHILHFDLGNFLV